MSITLICSSLKTAGALSLLLPSDPPLYNEDFRELAWCRDAGVSNPHTKSHLVINIPPWIDILTWSGRILFNYLIPLSKDYLRHDLLSIAGTTTCPEKLTLYKRLLVKFGQNFTESDTFIEGGNVIWVGKESAIVGWHAVVLTAHLIALKGFTPEWPETLSDDAYWAADIDYNGTIEERIFDYPQDFPPEKKEALKITATLWQARLNAAEKAIKKALGIDKIAFVKQRFFHIDLEYLAVGKYLFTHSYRLTAKNPLIELISPRIAAEARKCASIYAKLEEENRGKLRAIGLEPINISGVFPFWKEKQYNIIAPMNGITVGNTVILTQQYTNFFEKKLAEITAGQIRKCLPKGISVRLLDQGNYSVSKYGGVRCKTNEFYL